MTKRPADAPHADAGEGRRRLPVVRSTASSTPLPPLYAAWLDELIGAPTPAETDSTCEDCAMCRLPPVEERWEPSVKCCTYMPYLPNFLVGGILVDRRLRGGASVRARIEATDGITPLGAAATTPYRALYRQSRAAFGRAATLRCPHLEDDGTCGIWAYRNGVCATYFCLPVRDEVGRRFWHATRELFAELEDELAVSCLLELEVEPEVIAASLRGRDRHHEAARDELGSLGGAVAVPDRRRVWGRWIGRERELYARCFEKVSAMRWTDVSSRCGPRVSARAAAVKQAHAELVSTSLPERLRLARVQVETVRTEPLVLSLQAPGRFRGIEAEQALFDALTRFDGRTIDDVLAGLARDGVRIERATVATLVDLGILVETQGADSASGATHAPAPSTRRRR
ncbi:MAG: hypothetical protein IT379_09735 [Deltaproteobacteria bacterium]|nr:hypothetical protein [Deltaproteobacteria bacterium]